MSKKISNLSRRDLLLLVTLVVLFISSTAQIPFYGGYVRDAKATQVLDHMQALASYAQGYIRSHPGNWNQAGMLLGKDANGTVTIGDGDWVESVAGNTDKYCHYEYKAANKQIRAWGKVAPFNGNDQLIATLGNNGAVTWSATGKFTDIIP